jgi:hypothetical protein
MTTSEGRSRRTMREGFELPGVAGAMPTAEGFGTVAAG